MEERNVQPNAIFEGEKLSVTLSASLADPQSAKQTNVILMKERNGQPNETNIWITQRNILRGKSERITQRNTSNTLADPQSAKQTNVILSNETKKWTTKCKILR